MKNFRTIFIMIIQTLTLTAVTVLCVVPFSCRVSEEGIVFVGGDYTAPLLEEVTVLDERTVKINFSEKIKMKSFVVSEQLQDISDSFEHSQTVELSPALKAAAGAYGRVEAECSLSEDNCAISFTACDKYKVGKAYEIFGTVEDKAGNTLTFCVPFCGYNSHIPKLIMTELLVKHDKNSCKGEFVEILSLTEGNLAGIELVSGSDGEKKKFVMPAVEVAAGEIVLVHLRRIGEGCITEEENLNESSAPYSVDAVRDIWSDNEESVFSDTNDVIILRKGPEGELLDVFMYNDKKTEDWKKPKAFAELAFASGIYDSVAVDQVFPSKGVSANKSFQRINSEALRSAALSGELEEYPVKYDEENWLLNKASPGYLE